MRSDSFAAFRAVSLAALVAGAGLSLAACGEKSPTVTENKAGATAPATGTRASSGDKDGGSHTCGGDKKFGGDKKCGGEKTCSAEKPK